MKHHQKLQERQKQYNDIGSDAKTKDLFIIERRSFEFLQKCRSNRSDETGATPEATESVIVVY